MKKLFIVIFSIFLFSQNLMANEQDDIKSNFMKKIDEVILIVQNKNLSKEQRNNKIVNLLNPTFDFELMAKLSLGKAWKSLAKENQEKFITLYVDRMKKSYSSKLDSYGGQKIEITSIKQPKKNRIEMVTNLISADKKFEVSYKYYKPSKIKNGKEKWLIYDAVILGVSILKTDRAQFKEFLKSKSIDDLMVQLAK